MKDIEHSGEMEKKKREFIKKLESITPREFFRFLNEKKRHCGLPWVRAERYPDNCHYR
ncbi:hypothetical protein [Escherichia coli]|uniref:hypothetical protein n=1 Tax=Escherichia coli TaxID=562 RepID=UPI003079C11B